MPKTRPSIFVPPSIFVGACLEAQPCVDAIQDNLDSDHEVIPWNQGMFGVGQLMLTCLEEKLARFDFAILVLTADDVVVSRGEKSFAPRDNILLEIGFCMGKLGVERTFLVCNCDAKMKLPSDLAGIVYATFRPPVAGTWETAMRNACTRIKHRIREIGPRKDRVREVVLNTSIRDLTLSSQVVSRLHEVGVENISDLIDYSEQEFLSVPGLGPSALDAVNRELSPMGLQLKHSVSPR